jgi:non-heme chloroperoxidase
MGHSFGELFTQLLLSRGLGLAGVAISPAQPSGIKTLKLSTVKAGFGILGNPLNYNKAVPFTEKQFHYGFGNHLDAAASKALWEKYAVPGAGHVLWVLIPPPLPSSSPPLITPFPHPLLPSY